MKSDRLFHIDISTVNNSSGISRGTKKKKDVTTYFLKSFAQHTKKLKS